MRSYTFIDRRDTAKKRSLENRQRFIDRIKAIVKDSAVKAISSISSGGINDASVKVNQNEIDEPFFAYFKSSYFGPLVLPGNFKYVKGDEFEMEDEEEGQGGGSKAGNGQGGQDDFTVNVSRADFLNVIFEDLELPNLKKKESQEVETLVRRNAGFTPVGAPARLSVVRTLSNSKSRIMALRMPLKRELALLEEELEKQKSAKAAAAVIEDIVAQIEKIKNKISSVPFLDDIDLRYRKVKQEEIRRTKATIIFIMDNSGSMGEREKTLARKFFTLYYMFVQNKFEKPDVVFISHTDVAKEVDEQTFFNTRENGGTVVSSALTLANQIIRKRYDPSQTNLYICQASDGDNFDSDNKNCIEIINSKLMPMVQHFMYLEIRRNSDFSNGLLGMAASARWSLWGAYQDVENNNPYFDMEIVTEEHHIIPTFRKVFKKRGDENK
jgi:uncharacterized sporulation protein YeaH/YhbH (DUF444 family)